MIVTIGCIIDFTKLVEVKIMFYLLFYSSFNSPYARRRIISALNGKDIIDLRDEHIPSSPSVMVMDENSFKKFLKYGYTTKEEALNDMESAMRAIVDYNGPWFDVKSEVVDKSRLQSLYKNIKNNISEE